MPKKEHKKKLKDKSAEENSADRINYLVSKGIVVEGKVKKEHKHKIKKVK